MSSVVVDSPGFDVFRRPAVVYCHRKGGSDMSEYFKLFNAITDAIRVLEELRAQLVAAQQEAEEQYISRPE